MQMPRVFTLPRLVPSLSALLCAAGLSARAGGVVSDCTETALRAALTGGGTVTFSCSGTIIVTNTVVVTTPTVTASDRQVATSSNAGPRRSTRKMPAFTMAAEWR